MQAQDITDRPETRDYTEWGRQHSAQLVYDFEQERARRGVSLRAFARERGVPRTTLQSWLERKATLDADPDLVEFMESPVGLAFLHRLVLLLHLVFCQAGPCGVDRLCLFLRLSGLASFVASSHGEQHEVAAAMRSEILAYEQAQRAKQAPGMRRREIAVAAPRRHLESWQERKACHDAGDRPVGRPPDYARHIAAAELELAEAEAYDEAARRRADQTREAIRSLSTAYHPVDLQTGELRSAATIEAEFDRAVATIDETVDALDLSDRRRDKVAEAKRVLPKMIALVAFFFTHLNRRLEALGVSEEIASIVRETLVPAFYLQQVARRRCSAAERDRRLALSRTLLARAYAPGSAFAALPADLRRQLERLADDCAALFVRATSCVEGCNGQLALLHHGLKRLDNQRLAVLRALHNYFLRRADGTTAAERFFESPHDDLLEWLLDHMDLPARPRRRRTQEAA